MISDGDSKAHQRVLHVYGESQADRVKNLDCIGHVGKLMYRPLNGIRSANKGKLADGKPAGGRKGCLTEPVVRRLNDLYRNAIRHHVNPEAKTPEQKHTGVEKPQTCIKAVLYHSVKLTNPQQQILGVNRKRMAKI